jgi:hypothetical protein
MVHDRETVLMQRGQQSTLADDEGRPSRLLLGQEASGRHGTGEDMLLLDVDPHARELGHDVAAVALAVVGEEAERDVAPSQLGDEAGAARDDFAPSIGTPSMSMR